MSGEIEVTEELRESVAREMAEALEREGLNPGQVEPWEDGWRTSSQPDAFEWWYFDAQFADGSTAVITFSTKPMTKRKGPLTPTVMVIVKPKDGKRESSSTVYEPGDMTAVTELCDVRIGPSRVQGDLRSYELHAESGDLSVDLEIAGVAPPWRPGAAVSYFNSAKTRYFAWVVPVPYGTATGTVGSAAGSRSVSGTVYHDHNWGNAGLGNMIDHWYWGRAHVGDFSLIFVQMTTVKIFGIGGIKLPVLYVARGQEILTDDGWPLRLDTSDFVEGPGGQRYPTKVDFRWKTDEGSVQISLRNPKMIESIDTTADLPGWQRPLIHLFANPYYYDFDAELELTVDLKGVKAKEKGHSIYELMMFR
jgi:hypothetical protein